MAIIGNMEKSDRAIFIAFISNGNSSQLVNQGVSLVEKLAHYNS